MSIFTSGRLNKLLAVIPARGGSKGLPFKNIQPLLGKTLLERAIEYALDLGIDTIVTTNDFNIANMAANYPIDVKITTGTYLHSDHCKSLDVWLDAWDKEKYNASILLEPSSPLRDPTDTIRCIAALADHSAAMTVSETYPAEKLFTLNEHKTIHKEPLRRQDCQKHYKANGLCYAMRASHTGEITHDARAVIVDRPTANIDTYGDLDYAEYLLKQCSGVNYNRISGLKID